MKAAAVSVSLFLMTAASIQAAGIPKISTVEQLRAQPVVHLPTGWDIRLGISMPDKEAGPYAVLYADVQGKNPAALVQDGDAGKWLGPLFVRTQWEERRRAELEEKSGRQAMPTGLYALAIPVHDGKCHITIDDGKSTVWDDTIPFDNVPATPWQPFVGLSNIKVQAVRASGRSLAVVPQFLSDQPLFNFDDFSATRKDAEILFKKSLPLAMPLDPAWLAPVAGAKPGTPPLALAIDGDQFTLIAEGRRMIDAPDEVLLARWWVNGKAILPDPSTRQKLMEDTRKMSETDRFAVIFNYPETLAAKEGDTLTLQVLYAPHGYERASDDSLKLAEVISQSPAMPLLSNRLEFKLTKELLAARDKIPTARDQDSAK
jgi:hypothetical protein